MTVVSQDIGKAKALLESDDVVSIPTETVYGLAANIFSEKAITKVFELKQRPFYNPLIVHIDSISSLSKVAKEVPNQAMKLAETFWPGPLTLILPKRSEISDLVTAGKDTVGVRVPQHPLTLKLLNALDCPIAAPSANPFGSISPTQSKHVKDYFDGKLTMILDGGECQRGIESTIVGFENDRPVIYRLGSISMEEIQSVVGKVELKNKKESSPDAPGMLSRHYAPQTKTVVPENIQDFLVDNQDKRIGVILFNNEIISSDNIIQRVLSYQGDLEEAASKLYATLHELDQLELDIILAEQFPNIGLGRSINDRLERATKSK